MSFTIIACLSFCISCTHRSTLSSSGEGFLDVVELLARPVDVVGEGSTRLPSGCVVGAARLPFDVDIVPADTNPAVVVVRVVVPFLLVVDVVATAATVLVTVFLTLYNINE